MEDKDFFPNIKANNQNKEDRIVKEDGYYNTIIDHVVDYTSKTPQDLSMLQTLLKRITPQNVKYI
jgi:hypothetical protein